MNTGTDTLQPLARKRRTSVVPTQPRVRLVITPDPVRTGEWVRTMLAKARAWQAEQEQKAEEAA